MSQDISPFNSSIRDNITHAKTGATEDEIREAAPKVHAEKFIQSLLEGLETLLGDRGVLLSGGQKQRIAIARAIIAEADIVVFDEATSALHIESEQQVQMA